MHAVLTGVLSRLAPSLGHACIRALRRTMKIAYENRQVVDEFCRKGEHYIVAFWHSRLLMMPYGHLSSRMSVISSTHRDGMMLGGILQRFGVDLSKGSSTRGGVEALHSLIRKARHGFDLGFASDGPKGPRRSLKGGVIRAAKLSGLPIVPVAFSAFPAVRFASWDRMMLPKPFSRGVFTYGHPIRVAREIEGEEEERVRLHLENTLNRMTDDLDCATGIGRE